MFLIFALLVSVITLIVRIRIVARIWVWLVIFPMLTTLFLPITFLLLWSWVWWRCLWWRVWKWCFCVRVYHRIWFIWFVPLFFKGSLIMFVDCHVMQSKFVSHVSEIFSVWMLSRSKTCLFWRSEFLIWLLYALVSLTLSKPWLDAIQPPFKFSFFVPLKLFALVEGAKK